MKRRNTPLAWLTGIGLVLWMATGSAVYSSQCCTPTISADDYRGTWNVQDGEAFQLQAAYLPAFAKNDAHPIIPELLSKDLIKIVRYIKAHPLKTVIVVGLFAPDETEGAELGLARAAAMRAAFIEAGTPPYQVRTESGRQDDLPQNDDGTLLLGGIELVFGCLAPFELKDRQYGLEVAVDANFVFDYGSVDLLIEPPKALKQAVQQIALYLTKHPDRQLTLTGYNHPDEPYNLAIENLGLARANAIRSLLVEAGAPGTQIQVIGKSDQRLAVLESELYGQFLPDAMGFVFAEMPNNQVKTLNRRVKRIEEDLKERKVYRFKDFKAESHKIVLTDELRTYLEDLILYLSVRPDAMLYCVGHSLPRESEQTTALKGKERATFVRDFLIQHGIAPRRIIATTAADTHPLGTSDTRYGKQINRRVDLFVAYDGKEPQLYVLPPFTGNTTTSTTNTTSKPASKTTATPDSIPAPKMPKDEITKQDSLTK